MWSLRSFIVEHMQSFAYIIRYREVNSLENGGYITSPVTTSVSVNWLGSYHVDCIVDLSLHRETSDHGLTVREIYSLGERYTPF